MKGAPSNDSFVTIPKAEEKSLKNEFLRLWSFFFCCLLKTGFVAILFYFFCFFQVFNEVKYVFTKLFPFKHSCDAFKPTTSQYELKLFIRNPYERNKNYWNSLSFIFSCTAHSQKTLNCRVKFHSQKTACNQSWKFVHGENLPFLLKLLYKMKSELLTCTKHEK